MRVQIRPELFRWASERSGMDEAAIVLRFPKYLSWIQGSLDPTIKQFEAFARFTRTPVGYLFLSEPPVERLPVPDFRTIGSAGGRRPSPDLLETIYICQQRQEWYRDYSRTAGESPHSFVGSADFHSDVEKTATEIRNAMGLNPAERRQYSTWTDALRVFISRADDFGILVMCSGVVLNNTHRALDPTEFRGFALCDPHAPLVFVNGADTKAAQMFTLAHEIAHLWLGASGLSDVSPESITRMEVEFWCNQVAAEILIPLSLLRDEFDAGAGVSEEVARIAKLFKVSTLVVLRRLFDMGALSRTRYWREYQAEEERLRSFNRASGGNFYLTQAARVSKRFARALVASTLSGLTLHRDAFQLLGFSKLATFHELGRSLGVL